MTDSLEEALDHIKRHAVERFGLKARRIKPSTLLGEGHAAGPMLATPKP